MNLVTTGNAAIILTTCMFGLLLFLPRTNVRAAVTYAITMMRRPVGSGRPAVPTFEEPEPLLVQDAEPVRELVDA